MRGSIEQLIEEAENLEESNRPTEALERWRAAVASERRPELVMRLGRLCWKQGDVDEAERLLLEAIERAPGLSDAHYYLGFLYDRSGQLTRARECLERGLDLEEWGPGLTALGGVYFQLDMPLQARQAFERAQILDPADQEAWYGLGLVHRTSDHAKAIAAFGQSIAIDKDYGPGASGTRVRSLSRTRFRSRGRQPSGRLAVGRAGHMGSRLPRERLKACWPPG